jgi:hypothetical protein
MEIKIKPFLFAKYLGICELEAEGTLSIYKTDVAPQPLIDGFYPDHSLALRASLAQPESSKLFSSFISSPVHHF